jgi:penicillin-binding protein 1C
MHIEKQIKKIKNLTREQVVHILVIVVSLGIVFSGVFALWISSLPLPDFELFEERKVAESTKIYDRTGEVLLFDIHRDIKRTVVPLPEISRHVKNATIAIEDSEFYEHKGVKLTAILRAFFANIFSFDLTGQGGSTITQQVIKNTLLSKEKRLTRKIKEAVLSLKLEQVKTKDEILELYLNEVPYGGSIYGVEEASMAFFGKKSADVTLAQAAYLAAIPKAPTFYSPYGSNVEKLKERKNVVLARMFELGFISEEERDEAKKEEVLFGSREEQNIKAPHFVIFIREYLEKKYGSDVIETGGLKVTTTLDWTIQQKAEKIVKEYAENNSKNFNAHNASLVALDPKTGHILTMVGSRDWFSEASPTGCTPGVDCKFDPKVNIATVKPGRQPGSAFKPFVYAAAFKKGYTPETVLFDLKTQFSTLCDAYGNPYAGVSSETCYMPENYDLVFRGPVTIREALAQSINVPAVKTLYLTGLSNALSTAQDMGITTLTDPDRYGLTLVLGGGEVSLLELTSAYGVFASEGVRNPYTGILRVEDKSGNILEEYKEVGFPVLPKNIARQINDILSDNVARAPAFGSDSPLSFTTQDVAAKTGTTNDFRDAWVLGYTPNIVVGAWAGNSDNSSMEKKVAGFIIAPLWRAFMNEALSSLPKESFSPPEPINTSLKPVLRGEWRGSKTYTIDSISGKLATEYTPEETKKEVVLTQIHSILHWVNKDDPQGIIPEKPEEDSQYTLWETKVRDWVASQKINEENQETIQTLFDDIHTPESIPFVSISSPQENGVYDKNSKITVVVNTQGKYPITQIDYFLNETYLGTSRSAPFSFSFSLLEVNTLYEKNTLTVRVYDSVRNKVEKSIEIKTR